MPAKPSDDRKGSKMPEKKRVVFEVYPAKDPDIFEKLSSVRPATKYIRQLIRKDLEAPPVEEEVAPEAPPAGDRKTDREVFWENFPLMLKISGATLKEFADAVHVKRLSVYNWNTGKTYPHERQLIEICRSFGISRAELLEEGFPLKYEEEHLLRCLHSMSPEGKRQLMEVAKTLKDMYPENEDGLVV